MDSPVDPAAPRRERHPDPRRVALIEVGRWAGARGWMAATSGNLSYRIDESSFAITRSGLDKSRLGEGDFLSVDLEGAIIGAPPAGVSASAEMLVHCALYRRSGATRSVVHTHSPAATTLSRLRLAEGVLCLEGYEMAKALSGVSTHDHIERIPIVANTQDMRALSATVEAVLAGAPFAHGFLVAGHGLYTWGADVEEARRHLEAIEFLLECEARALALVGA